MLAIGAGLATLFEFLGLQKDLETHGPEFIALALLGGALYLAGVFLVEKYRFGVLTVAFILAASVLFRLSVLRANPSLSEDVYRYQWDGRAERRGINPYTVFPGMMGFQWLEDPAHPLKTGRDISTVYPPASEMAFAWVETVAGYKRLFTALDLATLVAILLTLLVLEQPLPRVLIYAWNPGVVISFALCGHHDSLAIFTLVAANFFIIGQSPFLSIASLGLSFLSKFFPALLVPIFLKRTRWVYAVVLAAVVALGYVPFADAGWGLLRGLRDFAAAWEANDSLFRLFLLAGNSKAQAGLVAAALILGLVVYALKSRMEPLGATLLLSTGLLLLSPVAFPWYFTWMVPFLCFYPRRPLLLMSVTCVLGYSPVVAYAASQPYKHSPFILALEYAPALAWLGWDALRKPSDSTA